ncbi:MAG: phenylalanine--tRNA ligase subunit beta [Candidatus Pacebacteria bacterium]|nr:phenylalanine--tRNA ligase subunit beta [Candidatus Paceibacterota bacterium]
MKFSYNWLQEYFDKKLPEVQKLAEKVGLHAFELEGVEKLESGDFLIEWDVLPNRSSDCFSYDGIASEVSAILDIPRKYDIFNLDGKEYGKELKTSDFVSLLIQEKNLINRATKRLAVDVKVKPSPDWLKEKLESIGQKSINNVVDITNYVMWVTGQPVHAFDFDKLDGKKKNINIRFAKKGEKVIDLSGAEHELDEKMLVLADDKKAMDIAGVKGGEITGIDENTTKIVMSAVNFNFENIRNTAKRLKLQTDASKRYENEVPLCRIDDALALMSYLFETECGAKISNEILDTNKEFKKNKSVRVTLDKINSVLGVDLEEDEVMKIFNRLNFKTEAESGIFIVTSPIQRLDLNIEEDFIEEVGRIYGYTNIPETPIEEGFIIPQKNIVKDSINFVSDVLVSDGFFEVYSRTLVDSGVVKLKNSLNARATTLRKNLLDLLKEKVEKNLVYSDEPKLFEIGKVFEGYENSDESKVVNEYFSFAGIIGKRKIKEKQKEELFYRTKGYLEKIFEVLSVKNIEWKKSNDKNFVADIYCADIMVGGVGINFWEINFEKLVENINESVDYKKVSKYPKIERDVAFWVPSKYTVKEAEEFIKNFLPEEAIKLSLFDIFKKDDEDKKSFAFSIIFQSYEKTLSDIFVNEIMDKIYKKLEENGFEIR